MSTGTDFTTSIFIRYLVFNNQYQLDEKIEELEEYKNQVRTKLMMFSSANLHNIINPDWKEQPIDWLYNEIDTLLSEYTITIEELQLLYLYKETIENGKATFEKLNSNEHTSF